MKLIHTVLLVTTIGFCKAAVIQPKPFTLQLYQLTAKEVGVLRGRPLTKLETHIYNSARNQSLKSTVDPTEKDPKRFNILGFLLGLFFPYGLIASYFFKDKSVRRSAWIGTAVVALAAVIILLVIASQAK